MDFFPLTLLHRRKVIICYRRLRFNVETGSSNIIYIMIGFKQCRHLFIQNKKKTTKGKKKNRFCPFLKKCSKERQRFPSHPKPHRLAQCYCHWEIFASLFVFYPFFPEILLKTFPAPSQICFRKCN